MSESQFAMLYRWKVDPAKEDLFMCDWKDITATLQEQQGALGSCLSRDEEGMFFAFARWPSEEHFEQAQLALVSLEAASGVLDFQQIKLWVEDDLLCP